MNSEDQKKGMTQHTLSQPTHISLSPSASIDLSWLPEEERKELMREHAKGLIEISHKAQEMHVDSAALKNTLDNLSSTTKEASENGSAVTISHTQTTSIGRTEVLVGNTEKAKKGRLTKSQTGEKDWTFYYISAFIIAVIVISMVVR